MSCLCQAVYEAVYETIPKYPGFDPKFIVADTKIQMKVTALNNWALLAIAIYPSAYTHSTEQLFRRNHFSISMTFRQSFCGCGATTHTIYVILKVTQMLTTLTRLNRKTFPKRRLSRQKILIGYHLLHSPLCKSARNRFGILSNLCGHFEGSQRK